MTGYDELIRRLREIEEMGYIRTHRAGNTGVGKTLEDLLGIKENNIPGPNSAMIELKSARKNAKSMLTLFTKSPLPEKANSVLTVLNWKANSSLPWFGKKTDSGKPIIMRH